MTDISLHIEYLLQRHDCVIVPGLGAFVAVCSPAVIDAERDVMTPPLRTIQFNAAISSDDGLLASSYSRRYGLNYTAARERLLRATDVIRRRLSDGETVTVGRIGTLTSGAEGRIVFTPRLSPMLTAETLGLPTLSLRGTPAIQSGTATASERGAGTSAEITVPTLFGRRRISEKNLYIAINRQAARVAAAALICVAVASAILLHPYSGRRAPVEASMVPVEKILKLHSFENQGASEKAVSKSGEKTGEEANVRREQKSDVYEERQESRGKERYHLIVATFHREADAAEYIAGAPADVKDELRTVTRGRTSRVSLYSSDDREVLSSRLNSDEVTERFPGAWIWDGGE